MEHAIVYPKFTKEMKATHKILIPNMAPIHFAMLREAMLDDGYNAEVLDSSGHGSCSVCPPPTIRRPLLCTHPADSLVSMPMAIICLTARGVRPSPQTLSRGKAVFSSSATDMPCWARW